MDMDAVKFKVVGPTPGPDDKWFVHIERLVDGKLEYNAAIPVLGGKERAIKAAEDLRKVIGKQNDH